jgi:hypothetical protein
VTILPRTPGITQYHDAELLTTPGGGTALIDTGMIPLVQALWYAGFATFSSCQDIGESITGLNPRKEAYFAGQAFLELPPQDAWRLARLAHDTGFPLGWAEDGAWEMYSPLTVLGDRVWQHPLVQAYFPAAQIGAVTDMIQIEAIRRARA